MTTFSDMVQHLGGVPASVGAQLPISTGTYFWVYSGTGNDGNSGLKPGEPLATIDAAIGKCTADKGDVIVVMPGHAESIADATSLVVDVDGVSIIGLGNGRNRPVISYSNAAGRIPVTADDVLIRNLVLLSAVADVVSGMTVTGDDVTLEGIEFNVSGAALEFLQMLDIDASARTTVRGCQFIASTTAGTNTAIRLDATDHCLIEHCEVRGDFTAAAVSGNAGSAAASTNTSIRHSVVENRDTTAGLTIDLHDSGTGVLAYNALPSLFATNLNSFDSGNALVIECYVVNAVDEHGANAPGSASA